MNKQNIILLIQGPTSDYQSIIDNYKSIANIVWSTWENEPYCNISKIMHEIPHIKFALSKLPEDNDFIKSLKKDGAYSGNVLQVFSTFNGLKYIKDNFSKQVLNNHLIVKIRSDEYFNLDKLLLLMDDKLDDNLYTINYLFFDISDHLFACRFDILYKTFENLVDILNQKKVNEPKLFHPNCCVESTICFYLKKYGLKNIKVIDIISLNPCNFKSKQNKSIKIDEKGCVEEVYAFTPLMSESLGDTCAVKILKTEQSDLLVVTPQGVLGSIIKEDDGQLYVSSDYGLLSLYKDIRIKCKDIEDGVEILKKMNLFIWSKISNE